MLVDMQKLSELCRSTPSYLVSKKSEKMKRWLNASRENGFDGDEQTTRDLSERGRSRPG